MHQALAAYGRFAARHPLRVIAIWLFFMVAIGVSGVLVGQATDNTITLPGSESAKAQDIRNADFPDTAKGSGSIVFTSASVDFRTSAGQADLKRVTDSVRQAQHVTQAVLGANSVSSTGDTGFIQTLETADIILLAGEALSHCVANSVSDIASNFSDPRFVEKVTLLTDASSNVPSFEKLGSDFVARLTAKGMKTSTTTAVLT